MIPVVLKNVAYALINIFEFLIVARAIMSILVAMVRHSAFHRIYDVILAITEPVLAPIRKLLERIPFLQQLPIDFSPLVILLILSFLGNAIIWL